MLPMLQERMILVPLASPFTDDGSQLSEARVARMVRWHLDQGAGGFVVMGDSGEWWSLAFQERKQLIEWVTREAPDHPVYIHATALNTAAILDLCQTAARFRAAGAVVTPPPIHLHENEIHTLGLALRRYGDLPVAFLDPHGHLALEGCGLSWEAATHEAAISRAPQVEEALVGGMTVTPLALFGAKRAAQMSAEWPRWKIKASGLIKMAQGPRLAKAVFQALDMDLGVPRPPVQGLDGQARDILRGIIDSP
jgi:dihydrodipicolinate synthase/N-acetylneuraminate lyase